jgi:hypothetical protein
MQLALKTMTILKNIWEKLIAHTSPHKSKDSTFSEKLNEFSNKMTKRFFTILTIRAS